MATTQPVTEWLAQRTCSCSPIKEHYSYRCISDTSGWLPPRHIVYASSVTSWVFAPMTGYCLAFKFLIWHPHFSDVRQLQEKKSNNQKKRKQQMITESIYKDHMNYSLYKKGVHYWHLLGVSLNVTFIWVRSYIIHPNTPYTWSRAIILKPLVQP